MIFFNNKFNSFSLHRDRQLIYNNHHRNDDIGYEKRSSFHFFWLGRYRYKFTEHLLNHYQRFVPKSLMTLLIDQEKFYNQNAKIDWNKRYSFTLGKFFDILL